jgi:hypothetical protein
MDLLIDRFRNPKVLFPDGLWRAREGVFVRALLGNVTQPDLL